MRSADVPPLTLAIRAQHERALARAHQHPYATHLRSPSASARRGDPPGRARHLTKPPPHLHRPITALRHSDSRQAANSSHPLPPQPVNPVLPIPTMVLSPPPHPTPHSDVTSLVYPTL